MSLQLRRGASADRTSITPAQGEPIFTTDTKKLYVGDGTTAGGVEVGGATPAGSSGQIQLNSSGAFGADAALSFNTSTNLLTLGESPNTITFNPSDASSNQVVQSTGVLILNSDVSQVNLGTYAADATRVQISTNSFGAQCYQAGVYKGSYTLGRSSGTLDHTGTLNVSAPAIVIGAAATSVSVGSTTAGSEVDIGHAQLNGTLKDVGGAVGTSGQVLTSTGTGVQWATPSGGGGGGSDGTIPLITQAYAVTEGYSVGDFTSYVTGNGYVRPADFGQNVTRAGVMECGVATTASGNIASLGAFQLISSTIHRSTTTLTVPTNTVTAALRLTSLPTATTNDFRVAVCLVDDPNFTYQSGFGTGTMGVSIYVSPSQANWRILFAGGDPEIGFISTTEFDSGIPKSTSWVRIQLITQYTGSQTNFTVKFGSTTVLSTNTTALSGLYNVDMGYAAYLTPQVVIKGEAGTGANREVHVDHFSILSEVVR